MKKLAIALLLSAAIMMTGCQGNKTGDTPAASKTEEVDQASSELKEKLGDGYILPSEAVTKVLARSGMWSERIPYMTSKKMEPEQWMGKH